MSSGDIWSTGAFAFESPLKDLLDSLDYTIEDLLGEDELLQELRGLHPQLVAFFCSEENVAALVRCIMTPPPPPYEEMVQEHDGRGEKDDGDTASDTAGTDAEVDAEVIADPDAERSTVTVTVIQEDAEDHVHVAAERDGNDHGLLLGGSGELAEPEAKSPNGDDHDQALMSAEDDAAVLGEINGEDWKEPSNGDIDEDADTILQSNAPNRFETDGGTNDNDVHRASLDDLHVDDNDNNDDNDDDDDEDPGDPECDLEDVDISIDSTNESFNSIEELILEQEQEQEQDSNSHSHSSENDGHNHHPDTGMDTTANNESPSSPNDTTERWKWRLENTSEIIDDHVQSHSHDQNDDADTAISHKKTMTFEEYENRYIRYPYMACEVICCEVAEILDILVLGYVPIEEEDHCNGQGDELQRGLTRTATATMDDSLEHSSDDNDVDNENDHQGLHENHMAYNGNAGNSISGHSDHSGSSGQSILDLLFSMLFTTPILQLDDRRAGYLEKILTMLFRLRRPALTAYINGDHLIPQNLEQPSSSLLDASPTLLQITDERNCNGDSSYNDDIGMVISASNELTPEDGNEDPMNQFAMTRHQGGGVRLLKGLFYHLHSNSIMHIVQRLLMPKPPSLKSSDHTNDNDGDGNGGDDGDGLLINGGTNEEDDDDDCTNDMDEFGGINSNWADSQIGLKLLLEHLLVDATAERGGGKRAGACMCVSRGVIMAEEDMDVETETQLNASQHACEILTTVIQHSPLSSNVMKTLTSHPVLPRLIDCACGSVDEEMPDCFSMHESTMTTAMNVLEILVLQLGGYGTVPTTNSVGEYEDHENSNGEALSPPSSPRSDSKHDAFSYDPNSDPMKESEATELCRLLPDFLRRLGKLLKHPDASTWQSRFQYSTKPQKLLGASRLRIVRLLESLVLLSIREVDLILCSSDCLETCLDLFWSFPWCSMLHQSVANLLVHVLEGGEERIDLQLYFLSRCNLPKRLMVSFDEASFSPAEEDCKDESDNDMNGDGYSTVLAMKSLHLESGSSSLEAEHGSELSSHDAFDAQDYENETDVIPVSDHDVEAAIEQEEQLELCEPKEEYNSDVHRKNKKADDETNTAGTVIARKRDITFRMGYMGHVIIICQALVHACESVDPTTPKAEGRGKGKDQEDCFTNDPLNNSPIHKENDASTQVNTEEPCSPFKPQRNIILSLLRGNSYYSVWQTFVTTTLASETAVQSTSLGGYSAQEEMNVEEETTAGSTWDSKGNYDYDDDDIGDNSGASGIFVGGGDIDLDNPETFEIAASVMMESLTLPSAEDNASTEMNGDHSSRHQRRREIIGGQSNIGNGSEFGTVVQVNREGKGYVYDDPLGRRHHFDGNVSDEDENDEEDENVDTDYDVPVMDLFAGNFNFDSATEACDDGDDTGWANFDDAFDDATADSSSGIDDGIKSANAVFEPQSDPFSATDVFGIVANSARIMTTLDFNDHSDDASKVRGHSPCIKATEDDDR